MKKKIFVIVPGYNEEKHIQQVITDIKKNGFENIIFIDDGGTDFSAQKAQKTGAEVLRHLVNLGKGAATVTGCDYAIKQGADILILMDSDGQHKAKDLKRMIPYFKKNDVVFTYRS